jgi:hypothetical protein
VQTTVQLRTSTQGFNKPSVWNVSIPTQGFGEQHLGVLKNFTNAILKGEDLIARAEEGIHSVELGNAILQSGLENRTVDMPLDAAAYAAMLAGKVAKSTYVKKVDARVASADDFAQSNQK